jgi:monofunctional glycosyltransferase
LIAAMLLAGAALVYVASAFFYDDVGELKKKNPSKTAFMTHREFQWEFKGLKNKKITQVWVPLSKISPYAVKAVLIAEDDKFYAHEGFDFEAMQKAVEKDIKAGKLKYGGSTISQQLAKNLFLSPKRSTIRKLEEALITLIIETVMSKERIFEIYLNIIEWGNGVFGCEAAARYYFKTSAARLDAWEAAKLAAMVPNPRYYDRNRNTAYLNRKTNLILGRMPSAVVP